MSGILFLSTPFLCNVKCRLLPLWCALKCEIYVRHIIHLQWQWLFCRDEFEWKITPGIIFSAISMQTTYSFIYQNSYILNAKFSIPTRQSLSQHHETATFNDNIRNRTFNSIVDWLPKTPSHPRVHVTSTSLPDTLKKKGQRHYLF